MEELWDSYKNAIENKLPTYFKFMDFHNSGLIGQYLTEISISKPPDEVVADTLKAYAKQTGYIEIKGDVARLTKKGLNECQKTKHDWDYQE